MGKHNTNEGAHPMDTTQYTSEEIAAVGRYTRVTDPGFIELLEEDGIDPCTDEAIGQAMLEHDVDEFEDVLDNITF